MERLEVLKTYKIYIGGKFPRTESGRYYVPEADGQALGNICLSSRKDFRNAMTAARAAQAGWAGRSAYNRGQILYRIAEMLETRKAQFIEEAMLQGSTKKKAESEVRTSIDRLIHYAGWCDKYQQIFSAVNPVASSHFNFSVLEPTGVVFQFADQSSSLLGLISLVAPIIAGGNTLIILASETKPLSAVTFAEVLHSSDVPGGVVNILTGRREELIEHVVKHMDLNAIAYDGSDKKEITLLKKGASSNMKRIRVYDRKWDKDSAQDPYLIKDFCEVKTTWHPIENIGPSGSGY
ncbi:MAG: aldehyde dehydrogenase family protein [Flavobacteriales bacterium]|nr:aldehyde dehydrogenase family protein [Flavobacteriales bacterium]